MKQLKLDHVALERSQEGNTLKGVVEGKELYFKAPPSFELAESAEPFLAAMLIPAMQRKADVVIPAEYPVSARLLAGIDELQTILCFWYPELTRVNVQASATELQPWSSSGSGCLFSGGLDACYSLLKHADEISHLVYVRGIDLQLDNQKIFDMSLALNSEIASYMNKQLVVVESNIRFFIRDLESPPMSWYLNQAGGLASVSLALQLPRIYISSSNSYDALHPLGSHPVTDPLWSSERTSIVHTGSEKRRHEKLEKVAEHDYILQRIRVCWHDAEFNCGVCDKCVHYRVALSILGLEVNNIERLDSYKNLYGAHVNTEGEFSEWKDNLLLARKYGDQDAARAVESLLNKYRLKEAAKLVDESVFGGRLLSIKRKVLGN